MSRDDAPARPAGRSGGTPNGRSARTRADVLAAARRVFADKGYPGATVSDIAAAAGKAHGTFYLYFANKEAVFAAVVEEMVRRMRDDARALWDPSDVVGSLTAHVRRFFELFEPDCWMWAILDQLAATQDEFRRIRSRWWDTYVTQVGRGLRRTGAPGLTGVDVDVVAHLLSSMLEDTCRIAFLERRWSDLDEVIEHVTRIWLAAIGVDPVAGRRGTGGAAGGPAPSGRGTREALLRAAREVIAERGYAGATVAEITRRAGRAHGTFYLHFANTRAIARALLGGLARPSGDGRPDGPPGGPSGGNPARSPVPAVHRVFATYLRRVDDERDLWLLLQEMEADDASAAGVRWQTQAVLDARLGDALEAVRVAPWLDRAPAVEILTAMLGRITRTGALPARPPVVARHATLVALRAVGVGLDMAEIAAEHRDAAATD